MLKLEAPMSQILTIVSEVEVINHRFDWIFKEGKGESFNFIQKNVYNHTWHNIFKSEYL